MKREYFMGLEQGSEEWFNLRAGCVTASEFKTVLAKGKALKGGGKAPSKGRHTYMLKMLGERLTGEPQEFFSNHHMERGKVMEEEARLLYEMATDQSTEPCGFIKLGEEIGYSPDALVGEPGLAEIKTRLPHLQLELLLAEKAGKAEIPPEHIAQCQGGLWVADREWVDFVSYWPKLPIFIKRLYRDEEYIKNLADQVEWFLSELHQLRDKFK